MTEELRGRTTGRGHHGHARIGYYATTLQIHPRADGVVGESFAQRDAGVTVVAIQRECRTAGDLALGRRPGEQDKQTNPSSGQDQVFRVLLSTFHNAVLLLAEWRIVPIGLSVRLPGFLSPRHILSATSPPPLCAARRERSVLVPQPKAGMRM